MTHIDLKVNEPRQNQNSMSGGEMFNFYVYGDIKALISPRPTTFTNIKMCRK